MTDIYCATVLEAGHLRSRCLQGWFLSPWPSSPWVFMPSSSCVCLYFLLLLQEHPSDRLRAHPKDPILTNHLFKDPVSRPRLTLKYQQLELQHSDFGGTSSTTNTPLHVTLCLIYTLCRLSGLCGHLRSRPCLPLGALVNDPTTVLQWWLLHGFALD